MIADDGSRASATGDPTQTWRSHREPTFQEPPRSPAGRLVLAALLAATLLPAPQAFAGVAFCSTVVKTPNDIRTDIQPNLDEDPARSSSDIGARLKDAMKAATPTADYINCDTCADDDAYYHVAMARYRGYTGEEVTQYGLGCSSVSAADAAARAEERLRARPGTWKPKTNPPTTYAAGGPGVRGADCTTAPVAALMRGYPNVRAIATGWGKQEVVDVAKRALASAGQGTAAATAATVARQVWAIADKARSVLGQYRQVHNEIRSLTRCDQAATLATIARLQAELDTNTQDYLALVAQASRGTGAARELAVLLDDPGSRTDAEPTAADADATAKKAQALSDTLAAFLSPR